ncbi:formylglycine-generating enzyme family protein [Halomonas sp. DP5Y7-2]|uniref:formylglycine-generating enzyme family protein n=1 Tax=Halomonas sp. DP5Y7-2 TaxID=2859076 RepID=UPI001C9A1D0D|nr:SUMF1/EgtB/PvdO family nonheme iron enzyme [Halomonas sp. DP5Y7-2]MBY5983686.1 formylglycine-generating enzyme family protein [Halomonas sp. DP5Y7-2]
MERFYRLSIPIIACVVMTGCDGSASKEEAAGLKDADSPVNQEAVMALIQKTMDNMIFVEGGNFQMGDFGPIDPKAEGLFYTADTDDEPVHEVTLDSYSISAVQVSYADYDIYTEATGLPKINVEGRNVEYRAPDVPAGVDWFQARDYCEWLGEQTGLPFSLPTEAQWEYAARSRGQFLPFATNNGYITIGENFPTREEIIASTPSPLLGPQKIGLIPPNPLGIYQMGLNGFEWVSDWYDGRYYIKSANINPEGPASGEEKVIRGSEFGEGNRSNLVINRSKTPPDLAYEKPRGSLTHRSPTIYTFRCTHDQK